MNTAKNIQLSETYFNWLKTLNKETKADLIAKLATSLQSEEVNPNSFQSLFGAFESEKTAEEIIEELRASRTFNRQIESF
jgi:ribosomal protein L16 Arg81 hydroxylase